MAFKLFEANRRLEEEKEHLNVTLNSIGEAIIATDMDGKVTRMNPVAEKMTASVFPQVRGKHVDEIFSIKNAETGEIEKNPVRKVIESGLSVGLESHVVLHAPDGAEFQIADSAAPIRNSEGKASGVVLAFRDMTGEYRKVVALKEAEKQLNKAYVLLKSSIESPQDMIILSIDKDYNYLYFNSYHKRVMLAAYGTDVQRGMNLISCMTNEDDIKKARINYDRALAGEAHITIQEYGEDERSWFETRYNPVLDDDGRVIGATAFSSNVTARILSEKRLKEAFAEAQRFRDMTLKLQRDLGTYSPDEPQVIRILFVDENSKDVECAIGFILDEQIDCTCRQVSTQDELEAALTEFNPDIVISECCFSEFSCEDVLVLVQDKCPASYFIVLTGAQNERDAITLKSSGADNYVIKEFIARIPFVILELLKRMKLIRASIEQMRKIRETEQRYRVLFENNHTVMLIVDPAEGRIRDVNQAACDFYGWSRETLLQMKLDQINILSPEEVRDEMARAVAEKRKNFHFRHRRADGSIVDVDVHAGTIELEGKTWILAVVHDITEKIAALKEKEDLGKRLSHYLATSPTITYSLRFNEGHDHWQWVSENAGNILGYTTEEIMRPDWWFDNLHPVDRPRVLSAIAQLSGDSNLSLEYRFLRKNRTILWLRDEKRWTTSISGDLEIVGSLTDISECKTIEAELILKSSALESTANPMIITDGNGSIEWVNKSFEVFTGYSLEEAIGKNPKELLSSGEQHPEFYRDMWSILLSGNTWRGLIVNRKKNGERCTEEMTITPIPDQTGHLSHFIAETIDITEHLRVEKELGKFQTLLKSSLESPKDMIILSIDINFRYLCFNTCHKNTMKRTYGIDVKPGMNILECMTDENDRIKAEKNFARALAGQSHITHENFGKLDRFCYETRYNPILDDNNEIIGATAFSLMRANESEK